MKKYNYDNEFVEHQKARIISRINKYKNPERIQDELLSGDISPYTRYKQTILIPILNKALYRIDSGIYGRCLKCGQDIEMNRLMLVPAAEYCIKCSKG
ncbi:MAG: TraR/DksA C4-type zinc finger protein [Patescibacteria group bacterium]|nr:TraR/DksA C4-type zinc finger protein [Patescibacteria group bacterium]